MFIFSNPASMRHTHEKRTGSAFPRFLKKVACLLTPSGVQFPEWKERVVFRSGSVIICLTFGFCTLSNAQSVTIDFGNVNAFDVSPYVESGFVFTASSSENAIFQGGGGSGFTSHYFAFSARSTTLQFAESSGATFSLKSLDLGVSHSADDPPIDIFLVGNLASGGDAECFLQRGELIVFSDARLGRLDKRHYFGN